MPDGLEVTFTRSISSSGSEYRVGDGNEDRVVSWDKYNAKLKSIGILVNARNFLVLQGDVENIASRNPNELTEPFEKISGSDDYKNQYENFEVQKEYANEKAVLALRKKKAISAERKQKKLRSIS